MKVLSVHVHVFYTPAFAPGRQCFPAHCGGEGAPAGRAAAPGDGR